MLELAPVRQLTERLQGWLLEQLKRKEVGWPAVVETDEVGVWTSAGGLRVLLEYGTVDPDELLPVVQYLLREQVRDGGWSLIRGDRGSSVSTGECLLALFAATRRFETHEIISEIHRAIHDGLRWLLLAQDSHDGGWGLENSRGPEGKSGAFCTAYAVLGLTTADTEEVRTSLGLARGFLLRWRDAGVLWSSSRESAAPLAALVTYALVTAGENKLRTEVLGYLEAAAQRNPLNGLLSLNVGEEVFQRGEGEVRLFVAGHYWSCRLALEARLPFFGIAALQRRLLDITSPFVQLECLVSGRKWPPTTWITIKYFELASLFLSTLEASPSVILESLCRLAGRYISFSDLEPKDFPRSGDRLGNLIAERLMAESQDDLLVVAAGLENLLARFDQAAATAFARTVRRPLRTRWCALRDGSEMERFIGTNALPLGEVAAEANSLRLFLSVLAALVERRTDEAVQYASQLESIELTNDTTLTSAAKLRRLALSVKNLLSDETGPFLALDLQRALENLNQFQESLGDIRDSPYARGLIGGITELLAEYRERARQAETVAVIVTGELMENSYRPLKIQLRSFGFVLAKATISIHADKELQCPEPIMAARPAGLGDFEAYFDVCPQSAGELRLLVEIAYATTDGESRKITVVKEFDVQPANGDVTPQWSPIDFRYEYGPIITDECRFIGRDAILAELALKVVTTRQPLAITGEWRIGKSSILRALARKVAKGGLVVCELDVQLVQPRKLTVLAGSMINAATSSVEASGVISPSLGKKLLTGVREVWEAIDAVGLPGGLSVKKGDDDAVTVAMGRALRTFKYIDERLSESGIVLALFIDEINLLAEFDYPESVLSLLRGMIQVSERIRFVVAAHDAFGPFREFRAPFFNIFQRVTIGGISEDATKTLLRLAHQDLQIEESAATLLYVETGGNPYWICAICDFLVQRLNRRRSMRVSVADVEASIEEAVQAQGEIFIRAWQDARSIDEGGVAGVVLHGLASNGGLQQRDVLEQMTIAAGHAAQEVRLAVVRLAEKGFVRTDGGVISMNNKLFARWIWKSAGVSA